MYNDCPNPSECLEELQRLRNIVELLKAELIQDALDFRDMGKSYQHSHIMSLLERLKL